MIEILDVVTLVESFVPDADPEARRSRAQTLALLRGGSSPLDRRSFAPGHVTASGLVLSPEGDRVLLVFHRRLRRWLQPGGHLEPDDAGVVGAARREVLEETAVELDETLDPMLVGVDVHQIPATSQEPPHLHHDLVFAFVARGDGSGTVKRLHAAWCPWDRLEEFAADAPLRRAARRARLRRPPPAGRTGTPHSDLVRR